MSNQKKRKYKARNFIIDILLILLTGPIWLIWIFCREMRNR